MALAQSLPQGLDAGNAGAGGLALGLELGLQLPDLQFHLGPVEGGRRAERKHSPRGAGVGGVPLTSCSSSCTRCAASWSSSPGSS